MKDKQKAVTKRLRIILAIGAVAIATTYVASEAGYLNSPSPTAHQVRALKDGGTDAATTANATDTAPAARQEFFVGDEVTIDHRLQINVEDVRVGTNMNGPLQQLSASKGGQYVVVIVTEKNVGSKPLKSFDMPSIHLLDPNGNRYDNDLDASMTASEIFHDDSKVLSDLNPGLQTTSVTAFEVSKELFDLSTWRLQIGGVLYRMTAQQPPAHLESSNAPPAATAPIDSSATTGTARANTPDTISSVNAASAVSATN
ncbi:DUF4352 domain-containing protein [Burkholderia sp. Bp9131]|uniref:DUF4352 domain-containing protein n=1 Tax=Burkholderia sp. Bp9131 TaxID=2184571 RepID=UPI000F56C795|nr:DUF4352 domain-containing protein [Burkholderia sp. Bp9131]RQR43474.1 DUF4352 domain-containing protein [Burkholderia sp. Bp9131]